VILRFTPLALLALLAAPVLHAQARPGTAESCRNPRSQAEMSRCAAVEYRAADAEMNGVYTRMRTRLPAGRREALRVVQLSWLRFRDRQCAFDAGAYEGGSMQPMVRFQCQTALTRERTAHLRAMLQEPR
jgi:uncharacterized protein YecT (DUF1311 family)